MTSSFAVPANSNVRVVDAVILISPFLDKELESKIQV
jgi:hypothetical protein